MMMLAESVHESKLMRLTTLRGMSNTLSLKEYLGMRLSIKDGSVSIRVL